MDCLCEFDIENPWTHSCEKCQCSCEFCVFELKQFEFNKKINESLHKEYINSDIYKAIEKAKKDIKK